MAIIEVKNLFFSYTSGAAVSRILDNINLSISPGEMVAIEGPSGSGKSTLLHIIGGLLTPDTGKVFIDGIDITKASELNLSYVRNRKIGFIFQQFHLIPKTNVLTNVLVPTTYPLEIVNKEQNYSTKALDLLKRLGLEDCLKSNPNQLSGGQQQRTAIARALINDPCLILADEPTGNLDSKSSGEILSIFKELNAAGKTVIIVTHDRDVAKICSRKIFIKDGIVSHDSGRSEIQLEQNLRPKQKIKFQKTHLLKFLSGLSALAFANIKRNKLRSSLTMLGVVIGVAAVLAMMTLGQFAKKSVLSGYESLGVNKLQIDGYPNWHQKASDKVGLMFRSFSVEKDIAPLKELFPEITLFSPSVYQWKRKIGYGGLEFEAEQNLGVSPEYFEITNRSLLSGEFFTEFHVRNRSSVCVLGFEVASNLFKNSSPLGHVVSIRDNDSAYSCRVIGVLNSQKSNEEWFKPDKQVILPYTFMTSMGNYWERNIWNFAIKVENYDQVEKTGKKIKGYFVQKYGKSGEFSVDEDAVMVSQIKRFLNIFTVLLTSVALISLLVGGIGITNMMLVSVSERFREIGIRKALGATKHSIKMQFLTESLILCSIAGMIGIMIGFITYETIIYGASKFIDKFSFEWTVNSFAVFISFVCIFVVGIASGLVPAIKAEKLDATEALRKE